ncbi:MAG: class I SAM-dependent methyltransferase [Desulfobacter sp.]|nr:class I SAM-dependent methyltransferase [Desulfobacter sp.]WDP85772.1 MAG: class I SAM-dependent methyltransferase [Desulfobacter sp.]
MENIFNKAFWINTWEGDRAGDTYKVHKGFATPEYWDKASATYNTNGKEIQDRRLEKALNSLADKGLLFEGMSVLDIGCGPGLMAQAMAERGAHVTAMDFSAGMLQRLEQEMPQALKERISLLKEDWHDVDIRAKGWEKSFDLVLAFMSPGVATPEAFAKMIQCSKKGCAVRGWAARRQHPIFMDLWAKIMKKPLDDKPQSILYKINLLFSMGLFPDISFDVVEWDQTIDVEKEFESQMAFFSKVSSLPEPELKQMIHDHLNGLARGGQLNKQLKGLTATAVFSVDPLI